MVVRARLSPEYVLDSITFNEIDSIMNELEYVNREEWERTRMIMYSVLQSQSTKQLNINDILPFDWDKKNEKTKGVTPQDIEEFKKRKNIN